MAEKEFINPRGLAPARVYTSVVAARGGRTIYVSGQIAQDAEGELIGRGNVVAQAEQVFRNLDLALKAAAATFNDVVALTTYVVNLKPEHRDLLKAVRARYVSKDHPPASTLVGVQALARPDFLVEVDAVAVAD
jgi:enamine deaminase RidA (YjgF/YER057c/UK114 family)